MESQPQKVDPPKHKKSFFSRLNYTILFTGLIGIILGNILTSYWGDLSILLPNKDKVDSSLEGLWKNSGILFWVLLIGYSFFRIFYGKNWKLKAGANFFIGPGLMRVAKKVVEEANQAKVTRETLTELAVHIFWRLTKIGIFGILVAMIPFMLLFQQNKLIEKQNKKVDFQNQLVQKQNSKIDIQNNLIEAERRSSLIFLMSNVLDKVDGEIKEQKAKLEKEDIHQDSMQFRLSNPLIARIVSLSRAFKPYKMLDGDTLSNKVVSPERGQLFISLMESQLDSFTQNSIVQKGDFSHAVIKEIDLSEANFNKANLSKANLSHANLNQAYLRQANFNQANLRWASFNKSYFVHANLVHANLENAEIQNANISFSDLRYSNFYRSNLDSTAFYKSNLSYANLDEASLNSATFMNADLSYAKIEFSDLSYANLTNANFTNANFTFTDLQFANFTGANLSDANLNYVNFDSVKNLTIKQLKSTSNLFNSENLPPEIEAQLRKEKPCLFTEEGCPIIRPKK